LIGADDVQNRYGVPLESDGAIDISAMIHDCLVFDLTKTGNAKERGTTGHADEYGL
jgi:hypothetical protein